jgi:uncharacterized protein (TIGR02453 family)
MTTHPQFQGFFPETVSFFKSLQRNNSRDWFAQHKETYDTRVLEPAKAFVTDLGEHLRKISPEIIAVPQINRSIFRIYRDTRFSPDKSPYKTHLALFFWEGIKSRMECPGFYFHLTPSHLMLGVGLYRLPSPALEQYRSAVVHPEYGAELGDIAGRIKKLDGYNLGGRHYKRLPPGFDSQHPNADLLLHNGLYAGTENPLPEELYSVRLIEYCMERFRPLADLHRWLVALNSRHMG